MVFGSVVVAAMVIYLYPKVLTDYSQVCAVELVIPEYFVPNIKTLRECLI